MAIAILFLSLCLAIPVSDAASLYRTIREAHAHVRDADFEYEGRIERFDRGRTLASEAYTARGLFVQPGTLRVEVMQPTGAGFTNKIVSSDQGKEFRTSSRGPDPLKREQTVEATDWMWHVVGNATYSCFWSVPLFSDLPLELAATLKDEGPEVIEGVRCRKISIESGERFAGEPAEPMRWVVWFDEARHHSVLRLDYFIRDQLHFRAHSIRLVEARDASGQKVWLPAEAVLDGYADVAATRQRPDRRWVVQKTPTSRRTFRLRLSTLRLNTGLKRENLLVAFDRSVPIRDYRVIARKQPYVPESEAARRASVGLPAKDLKVAFEAARQQTDELVHRVPANSGWGWLDYLAAGSVFAAIVLLIVIWRLRRSNLS